MRPSRGRRPARDAGTTLAETLVVVGLFGVVGVIVGTTVISGENSAQDSLSRVGTVQQAQVALDESSKVLRTAGRPDASTAPFVTGTGTSAVFYASVCSVPSRISLTVDASDDLIETSAPVTNLTQVRTRTLASGLTPASTVFTYLQSDGSPMTVAATGLSSAQRSQVAGVRLTLSVQRIGSHSDVPTTVRTDVATPNLAVAPYSATNSGAC